VSLAADRYRPPAIDEPKVTPELLANALCLPRASMRRALAQLQDVGVIRSAYRYVEVLDRTWLEHRACECYGVVKREFDRLLTGPTAA
jgi:hypothetical protein